MNTNMNMNKLALVICAMVMASGAWATDNTSSTMGTSASIAAECAVGSAVAMNFGALDMLAGTALRSSAESVKVSGGTFKAICTNGTTAPKLKFTSANGASGTFRLVGATDPSMFIAYVLKDGTETVTITDNAAPAAFVGLDADGATKDLELVGRIFPSAKNGKSVQSYGDTITITSSWD